MNFAGVEDPNQHNSYGNLGNSERKNAEKKADCVEQNSFFKVREIQCNGMSSITDDAIRSGQA